MSRKKPTLSLGDASVARIFSVGTTLLFLLMGAFVIAKGPGGRLYKYRGEIRDLEEQIVSVTEKISDSSRRLLEGEEGELLRSLFEQDASPSEYFNLVLDEIGWRSERDGMRLRAVSLSQPEGTSNVLKVDFKITIESPFPAVVSLLNWLEEVYPAYQVNHIEVARAGRPGQVSGGLSGSLYVPR